MPSNNKYELVYVTLAEKILGFDCDHSRYFLKYRNGDGVTPVVFKQPICRFKE